MKTERLLWIALCVGMFCGFFSAQVSAEENPWAESESSPSSPDVSELAEELHYALIIEGVPTSVRPLQPPTMADAVENTPRFLGLTQIVSFKIEKIVEGKLPKREDSTGPIKGLLKKIPQPFSSDYLDSGSSDKQLADYSFEIAVRDPARNFGIFSDEDLGRTRWRIYLNQYKDEENTFIMMKSLQV